jgi:hypothetical protein
MKNQLAKCDTCGCDFIPEEYEADEVLGNEAGQSTTCNYCIAKEIGIPNSFLQILLAYRNGLATRKEVEDTIFNNN